MSSKTTTTKSDSYTISTPPDTDIWRKPPAHNALNAPTYPNPLPTYDLSTFQRARLSFTLPPADTLRQFDQAGLFLYLTKPGNEKLQDKWLKTGIEYYDGNPYVSTVGCDAWSDWSIVPLSPALESPSSRPDATLEARRVDGKSLWVFQLFLDAEGKVVESRPLRELTWAFIEEEGWTIGIGGYVARPTPGGEDLLEAEFPNGTEVEVSEK